MKLFFKFLMIILIGYSSESYSQTNVQNDSLLNKPVKHSYKKIGLAYGNLGLVNFAFGANNQSACIGISAGFSGAQLGFGVSALSKKNIELNLLLNLSYVSIESTNRVDQSPILNDEQICINSEIQDNYFCFGPIVELYFYGFHSQLGIGFGLEQIPSPPIFFQIGYAYRWGK